MNGLATDRSAVASFFRGHPWVGICLVLATLLSPGCSGLRFFSFLSGDEAPIRVKGGSIHLELLNTTQTWKSAGDDKWKISGGRRKHEEYSLTIVAKAGTCSVTADRKMAVKITYSDSHWIRFTGKGHHTEVTSDVKLTTSADGVPHDGRTLSFDRKDGYISAVSLDDHLVCAFASKEEFTMLEAKD